MSKVSNKQEKFDVTWQKVWPDRMPVILRNLAPTNPFNPKNLWVDEKKKSEEAATVDAANALATTTTTTVKHAKKSAKVSKADLIRLQVAKDKLEKQRQVDEEKLSNVKKSHNLMSMKMETSTGRLKQLYEILRESCKNKEMTDAIDTLWEIQRLPIGANLQRQIAAPTEVKAEKTGKKGKGSAKANTSTELSLEEKKELEEMCEIHTKYKKYVKQVNEYISERDLIQFQLTEMSDRLPPLNMHHLNKFVLDQWQREVLAHIDNQHSVIVCAPTSSGKTVLSSYVTISGGKVLFIVPTEPLAWQVAALFQSIITGSVAVLVEGVVHVPDNFLVAVGTPKVTESNLVEIGYDFDYAVYDEVHDLNGEEGDALERIIKVMTCPFLALSATIGNASKLKDWWEFQLYGGNEKPTENDKHKIHLVEFKGRFINLQRMIWHRESPDSKQIALNLHPCAGVTLEYLKTEGFQAGDLAFTPRDTFALWEAMQKFYISDDIQDVSPHSFFDDLSSRNTEKLCIVEDILNQQVKKSSKKIKKEDDKKNKKTRKREEDDASMVETYKLNLGKRTHRITLMESKQYEEVVKQRLQNLAVSRPAETEHLLAFFAPPDNLKDESAVKSDKNINMYDLALELASKQLIPAIAFQLDPVRCRQLFDEVLNAIETAENKKYPNFRDKARLEYEKWEKANTLAKKRMEKMMKSKDKEEIERESQEFEEKPPPDIYAPHPDFILTPVVSQLTATEFRDIKWQLGRELADRNEDGHALIRGLRRGIGIYNENLPASYLRTVQALAQSGRLAVVFSDDSLAYGVNMPFRTCVFAEDTSSDILTTLMFQQMAGRAGRRGLDRQGNLVFAGLGWSRIQTLMRGLLPDVTGRTSLYPTVALHQMLSNHVDDSRMLRIVSHPLTEYISSTDTATADNTQYLEKSKKWMTQLGLLHKGKEGLELKVDISVAKLVWECRDDPAEAMGIFWMLDALLREFHHKPGEQIALQLALFNMLLRIVGREKYHEEYAQAAPLRPLPSQEEAWEKMTALLKDYDAKVNEIDDEEARNSLRLKVPLSEPLDGYVFRTVVDNLIPIGLNTLQLSEIKKRLRHVGDRLRLMHNLLMHSGRYGELEEIVRKCFRRIKWILIDSEV